jgi:hypothetical protein
MSWDVLLLKNKIDLLDTNAEPEPIGEREGIIEAIRQFQPDIDFTDKSWAIYFEGETSIELNIGNEHIIKSIMLHIRGSGDPHDFIALLCNHFNWNAIDCSTGNYMDFENLSKDSWERWQKYRDKILGNRDQ